MSPSTTLTRTTSLACALALALALLVALAPGQSADAADHASSPRAAADLTIRRVGTGTIENGQRLRFVGQAPASMAGRSVVLQRKVGKRGSWVRMSSRKIAPSGRYRGQGVATGGGANAWRFVARGASSPELKTPVYSWFYLADQDYVDQTSWDADQGANTVGGRNYNKSVYFTTRTPGNEPWMEFNLSYRCLTFVASIGLDDDSGSGASGSFFTTLDGARTSHGTKTLGAATEIAVDVSSRLRLRLSGDAVSRDVLMYNSFGNARVLCSGNPG